MNRLRLSIAAVVLMTAIAGCGDTSAPSAASTASAAVPAPSNRIPIPAAVRQNLGITFATVSYRPVATTVRVPGRFVALPEGVRHYAAPLPGRVEVLVARFQMVTAGTPLLRLDAPAWRDRQRELAGLRSAIAEAEAVLRAAEAERAAMAKRRAIFERTALIHQEQADELAAAVALAGDRLAQIEELHGAAGGQAAALGEARIALAQARIARAAAKEHLAEHLIEHAKVEIALAAGADGAAAPLDAAIAAAAARRDGAASAYAVALDGAAALLRLPVVALAEEIAGATGRAPRWRSIAAIEVRAEIAGVVDHIDAASGAWSDGVQAVVTTVDPTRVRFDGDAPQADVLALQGGAAARIAPPPGAGNPADAFLPGVLSLGPQADPASRRLPLTITPGAAAPWARPGLAAWGEVTIAGGGEELAIPVGAVIQDDLAKVFFRRDPADPDRVIRVEADLGASDGRWIAVLSGVKEGDQVVVDGVYELALTGGGKAPAGGHFHADGTFHAGPDH